MEIFDAYILKALGYTILHSIWQVSLIAIIMSIVLAVVKKKHSSLRYAIALSALIGSFILSISTFIGLINSGTTISAVNNYIGFEQNIKAVVSIGEIGSMDQLMIWINENLSWITLAWSIGMLFFILRILLGLYHTQNLKFKSSLISGQKINRILESLQRRAFFEKFIEIRESSLISGPSTAGYLKPYIFLPIGMVNSLSIQETEAVLAHELAHIIRSDFVVNIVQSFIEAIYYFHPAMWWISANIRNEREHACDDLAIQIIGDKIKYAKTLINLQEWEQNKYAGLAMRLSSGPSPLLYRIKRILNQPQNRFQMKQKIVASLVLLSSILWIAATNPDKQSIENREIEIELHEELLETDIGIPVEIIVGKKDTVPNKSKASKSTIVELKNGEIQRLEIDGKEIPKEKFDEHIDMVEKLKMRELDGEEKEFMYPHSQENDIAIIIDESVYALEEQLAEIMEHREELLEPLMEKIQRQQELRQEELDVLQDEFTERFGKAKMYYNDSIKFRMDTLMNRIWKFEDNFDFDFEDLGKQYRIWVDSMDFEGMGAEIRRKFDDIRWERMEDLENDSLYEKGFKYNKFYFGSDLNSEFIQELRKNDLYDEGNNSIQLSRDELIINGEKQSEELLEKFLELYQSNTGLELMPGSNLNIVIDDSIRNEQRKIRRF